MHPCLFAQTLYRQKLSLVLFGTFFADSRLIHSFSHIYVVFESKMVNVVKPTKKTDFGIKWHRPIRVIQGQIFQDLDIWNAAYYIGFNYEGSYDVIPHRLRLTGTNFSYPFHTKDTFCHNYNRAFAQQASDANAV